MPTRYIGMGYWEIASRQMSIVTKSQQTKFKESKIAVVGCGGIGGSVIEMLARMGVGELTLIDADEFDLSNLNRQLLSTTETLRKSKSESGKERVRIINPYVKVNVFNEFLDEKNVEKLVGDCDIIIDALDNIVSRIILSRFAKENDIPLIHGAIHGTLGEISVFTKDSKSYEEVLALPSAGKDLNDDVIKEVQSLSHGVPPVIGPVPNIIGALEAFEAFKYVTGVGEVLLAPKILKFDLLNLNSFLTVEL
ncbi:MAG: HesA/MoeB/ThiF family protein [Methanobacteriaceae archaeon]|nr:HesA/MoeB/ThiF family protein [Methanobacteriaceae archaeon]